MLRYLVVANQTLVSDELLGVVAERQREGDCCFHVVVPATPLPENGVWTSGRARAVAGERLDHALKQFAEIGAQATGEVGDPSPVAAISDALLVTRFDGIILSTLPPGRSDWLRQDLPKRVARRFRLPLHHVIATNAPVVSNRPAKRSD
jgi:GABA permease